jgi:hypothetical protein
MAFAGDVGAIGPFTASIERATAVWKVSDVSAPELVALVVALCQRFHIDDSAAGSFDAERVISVDLPGGAGFADLELGEPELVTLREILDCWVDVGRALPLVTRRGIPC